MRKKTMDRIPNDKFANFDAMIEDRRQIASGCT